MNLIPGLSLLALLSLPLPLRALTLTTEPPDAHANSIESTLDPALQYGLPKRLANELQTKADNVLKNTSSVGRPSRIEV